jgi:hypothetical protein
VYAFVGYLAERWDVQDDQLEHGTVAEDTEHAITAILRAQNEGEL